MKKVTVKILAITLVLVITLSLAVVAIAVCPPHNYFFVGYGESGQIQPQYILTYCEDHLYAHYHWRYRWATEMFYICYYCDDEYTDYEITYGDTWYCDLSP